VQNAVYGIEIAFALGLIIFVHELGHFLAAKGFGVWVRKFAIGFGPVIVKWQRGETEYSLRWIPLGGFVEPMGDHPEGEGGEDPRALWRKPAWQKIIIFAAGVSMNAVLALVFFTIASMIGLGVPAAVVGDTTPFLPAAKAGLERGDRLKSLNGTPVESMMDFQTMIMLRDEGRPFDVEVERQVPGSQEPRRIVFRDIRSVREPDSIAPVIGIGMPISPQVMDVLPKSQVDQAGLKKDDIILAVNGQAVSLMQDVTHILGDTTTWPVTMTIERAGQRQDLVIDPAKMKRTDWGFEPPVVIAGRDLEGPAAKAGAVDGDRVTRINDKAWPTSEYVSKTIKESAGDVRMTLFRKGEDHEIVFRPVVVKEGEKPVAGIRMGLDPTLPLTIGSVEPDGPAAKAGLEPGDVLVSVGAEGIKPKGWEDVQEVLNKNINAPVPMTVRRGDTVLTTNLTPVEVPLKRFAMDGFLQEMLFEQLPPQYNPLVALRHSVTRTYLWLGRVYMNVAQLVRAQVGIKSMGGPVRIAQASWLMAKHGLGTLMDFWGILSVCIAVLNFLPLPPFDGGHVLFVLVEKIKGSPFTAKARTAVWLGAWILVGLLFLVITYHDIASIFFKPA
jgi:regulator of sigma E protease